MTNMPQVTFEAIEYAELNCCCNKEKGFECKGFENGCLRENHCDEFIDTIDDFLDNEKLSNLDFEEYIKNNN